MAMILSSRRYLPRTVSPICFAQHTVYRRVCTRRLRVSSGSSSPVFIANWERAAAAYVANKRELSSFVRSNSARTIAKPSGSSDLYNVSSLRIKYRFVSRSFLLPLVFCSNTTISYFISVVRTR